MPRTYRACQVRLSPQQQGPGARPWDDCSSHCRDPGLEVAALFPFAKIPCYSPTWSSGESRQVWSLSRNCISKVSGDLELSQLWGWWEWQ